MAVTWTSLIDEMLQNGGVEHRHRCDGETESDPTDRTKFDSVFPETGVDDSIDKLVILRSVVLTAKLFLIGGLRYIHVSIFEHDPYSFECICDDRSLGGSHHVHLPAEDQSDESNNETYRGRANVLARIHYHVPCRSSQQRESADIDTTVENEIDPLDSDGWINDY